MRLNQPADAFHVVLSGNSAQSGDEGTQLRLSRFDVIQQSHQLCYVAEQRRFVERLCRLCGQDRRAGTAGSLG